jgi:hypothetical protein
MSANWVEDVNEVIVKVAGEERLREVVEGWQAHARRASVVVAVHGPFDSGKTTLIKRLLVEDGTRPPEWLTVSGRRETTSVASVTSHGLTYTDTPGTSGGNPEHDALAAQAVSAADIVLLLIPPQLVAEDAKWIKSFTDGTHYAPAPLNLFPGKSLLLVIAQSDTASVDPADSPEAFRALCELKRKELDKMLDLGPGESRPTVHVVSADPSAQVGGDPDPSLEDYDAGEWDGIAGLRADLSASRARLDELRAAARVRYWCLAVKETLRGAEAELAELRPVLEEARSRREHRSLLATKLRAVDEAAVADLGVGLADELGGLVTRAGVDDAGLRAEAERRLKERLESWYATYSRKMEEFAAEVDEQLDIERVRPASQQFDSWVADLLKVSPKRGKSDHSIPKLGESTGLVFKGAFWMKYGLSVGRAKDELNLVDKYKTVEEYIASKKGVIKTAKAVDTIKKRLPQVEGAASIASVALDFAPLAFNLVRDHRDTAAEQERRADLRDRVAEVATEMQEQVLGGPDRGWRGVVAAMGERLRADPLLDPVAVAASERIADLETLRGDLLARVSRPPTSAAMTTAGARDPLE